MKSVLVGITKIHSKKSNKDYCILHLVNEGGSYTEGQEVATEFVDPSIANYALVGQEVVLSYSKGYDGKAVCNGVFAAKK